jgi:hypothetical protein
MLCSQFQLRRQELHGQSIKLLPCRNWHCEQCQPSRLRQLRAIAASGQPNICLTLTINTATGQSPVDRYKLLHNAWKILVKRILREFAKPPNSRWVLKSDDGYQYQEIRDHNYTSGVRQKAVKRLHYMAFPEETENKEPHLHILLRTKYIPQRWISQQMQELINSPIVWIEKIKGARGAIAYVTKYVTTAPAQFGKSRRYWYSRLYQLLRKEFTEKRQFCRENSQLVHQGFQELVLEIATRGWLVFPRTRTEIELRRLRGVYDTDGTLRAGLTDDDLTRSYLWINRWRQELSI